MSAKTLVTKGWAILSLGLCFYLLGCSSVEIDSESPPEVQFAEGERLLKKERFIEAIERFRILKSRHPYSKFAALAALRIGDAHYQEESFYEAAAAYKIFRELYPKHEMAAYSLYRIGESQLQLVPDTSDRDLDSAYAAIDAYRQLQKEYPDSSYTADAEKKIRTLRGKLAEKEDYVGNFYFIRENYRAAAGRYSLLLDQYPEFGYNEKALYRLAFSYEKIGEHNKAQEALERLQLEFPQGKLRADASKLLKKLKEEKKE